MAVTRADGADFDAKMAGADLSEKVHYLAKIDTDGDIILATNQGMVYGIITEGAEENYPVTVQVKGLGKCIAGAAITAGASLMSNGDGKAVTNSGGIIFGIARSSVENEDEIVEVEIDRL